MKKSASFLALWLAGSLLIGPAGARELAGTLKKIKESGSIAVGYHEWSMPFTYHDGKGQVVGYSHDFAKKIVEAVKKELQLPALQVRQVPINPQNRFALIQNGSIDIECASTTNNTERQKQVAFSNTIFTIGTRLLTRKDSGIRDFADLAGKNVVTAAGTTSERLLRRMNEEKKTGMNIISVADLAAPLTVLQSGQAQAYMMDDALLHAVILDAWRPGEWIVTGKPQSFEAYGCMMRRNDPDFKKVVDAAIAHIMLSGEAEAIYKKWFMAPIPPKGANLNFPMSEQMIKLYKNPNDRAFD